MSPRSDDAPSDGDETPPRHPMASPFTPLAGTPRARGSKWTDIAQAWGITIGTVLALGAAFFGISKSFANNDATAAHVAELITWKAELLKEREIHRADRDKEVERLREDVASVRSQLTNNETAWRGEIGIINANVKNINDLMSRMSNDVAKVGDKLDRIDEVRHR